KVAALNAPIERQPEIWIAHVGGAPFGISLATKRQRSEPERAGLIMLGVMRNDIAFDVCALHQMDAFYVGVARHQNRGVAAGYTAGDIGATHQRPQQLWSRTPGFLKDLVNIRAAILLGVQQLVIAEVEPQTHVRRTEGFNVATV